MLNQRERAILELIRDNPLISQASIASRLDLKRSSVAGYIMHLQRKGLIRGRGYLLNEPRYVSVIGGANIDIEGRSAAKLRHHDSNIGSVRRSAGGVARNIAENLARLAIPTRLLTTLSDDDEGVWLRDETSRAGVDLADVLWSRHRQTATYVSILDEGGEMVLAVNDMGILDELDAVAIRERRETIANASVVVADCNLSANCLDALFDEHPEQVFFVDTVSIAKSTRIASHLPRIHTLKPNRAEASHLTGIDIVDRSTLDRAADWFLERGVERLFVSLGEDGLFFASQEDRGVSGLDAQPVVSATGAGDALFAGVVYGYLEEQTLSMSAHAAMTLARLALQSERPVSESVSRSRLERHLAERAS